MENQRSPLLSWAYFCHGKTAEELRHSLLHTSLELENMKHAAQVELQKRDDQLIHLKEMLTRAIMERDEAQEKYRKLLLDKLLLQQQHHQQTLTPKAATTPLPLSGVSSIEDDPRRGLDSANNGFSSSDCEESIVSSPAAGAIPQLSELDSVLPDKPLPEKGKLLQAVMKAGPLLQTLLLAGPLPQWRHPPPPLESFEIPPVSIPSPPPPAFLPHDSIVANCGGLSRKREMSDRSDSPSEAKFQRVALKLN